MRPASCPSSLPNGKPSTTPSWTAWTWNRHHGCERARHLHESSAQPPTCCSSTVFLRVAGARAPGPRCSHPEELRTRASPNDLVQDGEVTARELDIEPLGEPCRRRRPRAGGYFFIFRDPTEEKQREEEHRVFERLAAMGTMVAGFAHEVRNPWRACGRSPRRWTKSSSNRASPILT